VQGQKQSVSRGPLMRFSFSCPQCKRAVEGESQRAGTMTLCKNCLVAFPIPEAAPLRSTPSPVKEQTESELDTNLHSVAPDSGWRLVRLGLAVVEAAMVAFLVAGLVVFTAVLAIGPPVFAGPFLAPNRTLLILALFVVLAALATAFMGICLCWNAPAVSGLRTYARACVLLVLLAVSAGAILVALAMADRHVPFFAFSLLMVAFGSGFAAMVLWLLFLKGTAEFFHNAALANSANNLLAVGSCFFSLSFCILLSAPFTFLPALIILPFSLWNLVVVIRVRRMLALRNRPRS
jgi:hypothetical protein